MEEDPEPPKQNGIKEWRATKYPGLLDRGMESPFPDGRSPCMESGDEMGSAPLQEGGIASRHK